MALRAMCKYYILLTPSPSGESPTTQQPYWYRSLVTESLMFPMWMLPSAYGASMGCISVGTPSGLEGGGVTAGLAVAGNWFVSACTNNSVSSCVDSTNCHFRQSRWSLVLAVSCKCFLSWEALLWAVLARACAVYSSNLATWVYVTPACLPSQMARSFIGILYEGWDPGLYTAWMEFCISLPLGSGSLLAFTSEAHWPASPNSCKMGCLTIMPLVGVVALNHIQISTLDVLSKPSSACWMVVETPSGLCCHWDSIATISWVFHPELWSNVATSIGIFHTLITWVHACPACTMWEQFPSQFWLS